MSPPRFRRGAPRASLLLFLVAAGCSGAGHDDLFEPVEQQDNSATEASPSSPAPPPPAGGPVSAPDDDPPAPAADAGAGAPPAPKPAGCTQEVEPNDQRAQATPFTESLCGKLDRSRDVDFGRFTAPAGAKRLAISHSEKDGRVSYRLYVNGTQIFTDLEDAPVIPGASYEIRMTLPQGSLIDRPSYEVRVKFE